MLISIQRAPAAEEELSQHYIRKMPVLVVDLHSRCQCKCVMCDIWQGSGSHELSFDLLRSNRRALRNLGVEWVVLTGGEPLLHSRFSEICRFLRDEGIRITLLTAGVGLATHADKVAWSVDDVIVSLDGPRQIHDRIRGIARAYELLASGVVKVLSRRPEMPIRARTTVQKLNHSHLRETVEAAQELDLSGISFLAADLSSTAFNREEPWSAGRQDTVALDEVEVPELEAEIDLLVSQFRREFLCAYIAESPAKLKRLASHFRAHLGKERPQAPMCNAPWVSAVLGNDGTVRPCFFHPPIGALANETLDQAVNSPTGLRFRSDLQVEKDPICQRCVCSLYRP